MLRKEKNRIKKGDWARTEDEGGWVLTGTSSMRMGLVENVTIDRGLGAVRIMRTEGKNSLCRNSQCKGTELGV